MNELRELWDELDAADEWLRRGNTVTYNHNQYLILHWGMQNYWNQLTDYTTVELPNDRQLTDNIIKDSD